MPYTIFLVNLSHTLTRSDALEFKTMQELEKRESEETADMFRGKNRNILNKYKSDESTCVYGIQTNEATLKAVLQNTNVDELILIATGYVRGSGKMTDEQRASESNLIDINKLAPCLLANRSFSREKNEGLDNTLSYFIYSIDKYCKNTGKNQIKNILAYPVDDSPEEPDMTNCAIKLADHIRRVKENKKDGIKLFIDTNGGKREFTAIMIGVIRALQIHDISPEKIFYSDFESGKDYWGENPMYIKRAEYNVFDLVSGIDEFVEYGRVNKLQNYFNPENYPSIKSVLTAVSKMCEAFTTCFPMPMIDSVKKVSSEITSFHNIPTTTYLENYVVDQIRDDLTPQMLDSVSINSDSSVIFLIEWCYHKQFYQQAITLYVEKMPAWYVYKHFIKNRVTYANNASINNSPNINMANNSRTFNMNEASDFYNMYDCIKKDHYIKTIDTMKICIINARRSDKLRTATSELRKAQFLSNTSSIITEIQNKYDQYGNRRAGAPSNFPRNLLDYMENMKNNSHYYNNKVSQHISIDNLSPSFANNIIDTQNTITISLDCLKKILHYYQSFKIVRNNINHANGKCKEYEKNICMFSINDTSANMRNHPIDLNINNDVDLDYKIIKNLLNSALKYHGTLIGQDLGD